MPRGDDTEPDARFSLANERTFLAWNRTALGLVAAGVGVSQFARELHRAARLAVALPLVLLGSLVALTSEPRLRAIEQRLRTGEPLTRSRLTKVVALVIGLDALLAGGLLVADALSG